MSRWRVRIEVDSDEPAAARLRTLLPELLVDAGYTPLTGTTIIAAWLVESTAELHNQPPLSVSNGSGHVVHGTIRRKRLGARPSG